MTRRCQGWDCGPTVTYGEATFLRVCPNCSRFVTADASILFDNHGQPKGNNATCLKCGPVQMPFQGYL